LKVYINNYRYHWLSPYTILEKVFFWREIDFDEPKIEKWADRLAPFSRALQKVLDIIHPKINYVKIDRWDTWSMDDTLAYIILPMLKQLKESKQGSPKVDDEDVPEELKSTSAPPKENEYDIDENWHKRWEYVLNEMIFAFENKVNYDWTDKYYTGKSDYKFEPSSRDENGKPTMYEMVDGPNHTLKVDYDGMKVEQARMTNGFRLFGKYYEGLWD
jgi:hypothetical protein